MQASRQGILDALKRDGKATVDQLASALDLSPVTIRHHLAILKDRGLIDADTVRSGPGRPYYVYLLTEEAHERFPKTYHILAERLLEELESNSDRRASAQLMRKMADRILSDQGGSEQSLPLARRVEKLASVLTEEGFWAEWKPSGDGFVLVERECPYHYVAMRHPVVCTMDHCLIRDMSGMKVRRLAYRLDGDDVCSYELSPATG
ncbi:MAG: helix-turn-helix transcriptional regulator [Anaerolineae bacterium]